MTLDDLARRLEAFQADVKDAVQQKQDQDISLLKDVLRHLSATRR
jgi:hypothetical protein